MDSNMFENAYPELFGREPDRVFTEADFKEDLPIDSREIFDHIRDIKDPEHPMSLEELGVVTLDLIQVDNDKGICCVDFKPTIPHCSMATLIGLCIKAQLLRLVPRHFKVEVKIVDGTHSSYRAINKQLADKERFAAALENTYLLDVVNDCLMLSEPQSLPKFIEEELQKSNELDNSKIIYIRYSRQPIESYRRWKYVLDSINKKSNNNYEHKF